MRYYRKRGTGDSLEEETARDRKISEENVAAGFPWNNTTEDATISFWERARAEVPSEVTVLTLFRGTSPAKEYIIELNKKFDGKYCSVRHINSAKRLMVIVR